MKQIKPFWIKTMYITTAIGAVFTVIAGIFANWLFFIIFVFQVPYLIASYKETFKT